MVEDMNNKETEFIIFLATVSATFAISTLLTLVVLVFSAIQGIEIICQLLWLAAVLFAVTSFRCVDKILDRISEDKGEEYVLWPKEKKWQKILLIDKRVIDFGGAVIIFFFAWLFFSFVMYCIGIKIGLCLLLNYITIGLMIVFAILFITRKILS